MNKPKPKWTKGPWRVAGSLGYASYIKSVEGVPIACGYEHATAEGRANADLMAASPELFEALERLYAIASKEAINRGFWFEGSEGLEIMCEAKAALAKACGQPDGLER